MSLETDVANLVTKTTDLITYFGGKKAGIDSAVAAAVAAAPEIVRVFYVDSVAGDDFALGTQAAPLKTIGRALAATPVGGGCEVVLLKDYTLASPLGLRGKRLIARGDVDGASGRKLILNEYITGNGQRSMGGFQCSETSSVELMDLTLTLPDGAASNGPLNAYYSFVYAGGNRLPPMITLRLFNVVIELRGTFVGKLIGPNGTNVCFSISNSTIPPALDGSIIHGVAAGTAPTTLSHVITNSNRL